MKSAAARTIALAILLSMATPAGAQLTEGARLAAIYDAILRADFDGAAAALQAACPPAPAVACQVLELVALWWRIQIDPDSRLLDRQFEDAATAAIDAARDWTRREPRRAEAWFYFAGAHGPLVQWRVLRGQSITAAREAGRVKSVLERTLDLDPSLEDANFGIGLYRYYAGVAPAAARWFRWVLLLPGGNRSEGLDQMVRARDRGLLLRNEADYQLHFIYLWYEEQPAKALALLESLDARFPSNPAFLRRMASVHADVFHDHPASAASWQTLIDRIDRGEVNAAGLARTRAELGLARELDEMFETDRAIPLIEAVIAREPSAPHGASSLAYLQLGTAYDRLGDHQRARRAYEAAERLAPENPTDLRDRARRQLRQRGVPADRTQAYRLSLEGLRALERKALPEARALLEQSLALAPGDSVARYRYARTLAESGAAAQAQTELERVITARPAAPPIVLASAYADYATIIAREGDRERAIEMYRQALDLVGGAPAAHDAARRALADLTP